MKSTITLASDKAKPNELLMLLLTKKNTYVSGEDLSKKYGITRSAIWKQINALRKMGYNIKSSSRLGYSLEASPDLLLPEEIWSQSNLKILSNNIYYYTVIDSTNAEAKRIAQEGAPEGTLVIAEKQEKGRGRMSRLWSSPTGGIWFSIILRPNIPPQEATKLTIMTAVAVAEAIIYKTGIDAQIKWPNDILFDGKKVCGILTEMSAEMDMVNYIIVGIGINVNNDIFPNELKHIGTSLKNIKGYSFSRTALLAALLEGFEYYYEKFKNKRFDEIIDKWRSLCLNLDKSIRITGKDGIIEGIAMDIDESGALLVKTKNDETVRILSGDVSLR
ncbi:MAG: biotin--[acetyl-CoA-carboxylase] ligase [Tepidanaerobacteraceae bacterium]|jgi:BirA family biotin operon repressor/biotin-[acetyl-CoA-carboxylase] ligase|nr:biotin--[acetyl-CoA-carboxylase] ligase [Thermoanaerobacterales bacterium]